MQQHKYILLHVFLPSSLVLLALDTVSHLWPRGEESHWHLSRFHNSHKKSTGTKQKDIFRIKLRRIWFSFHTYIYQASRFHIVSILIKKWQIIHALTAYYSLILWVIFVVFIIVPRNVRNSLLLNMVKFQPLINDVFLFHILIDF